MTAARIGEYEAMQRWIAAAERCYREAGRDDRAVRMRLDPAFDYLPVRRSAAIRDEPVERLLVDAQTAMAAGDSETARGLVAAASTPPASAATAWRSRAPRAWRCSRSASSSAARRSWTRRWPTPTCARSPDARAAC